MSDKFGIQYQPLSQEIAVGTTNEKQTLWREKETMTDEAVLAVAKLVSGKYEGFVVMKNDELAVEIKVTKND